MRITESQLRKIVHQLMKEQVSGLTFDSEDDIDFPEELPVAEKRKRYWEKREQEKKAGKKSWYERAEDDMLPSPGLRKKAPKSVNEQVGIPRTRTDSMRVAMEEPRFDPSDETGRRNAEMDDYCPECGLECDPGEIENNDGVCHNCNMQDEEMRAYGF